MQPLHELNPIGRFSDRAIDYVKYRPGYPAEALDAILEGLRPPTQLVAADVGAGTGISLPPPSATPDRYTTRALTTRDQASAPPEILMPSEVQEAIAVY